MSRILNVLDQFPKNLFPPGQPVIITSEIEKCLAYVNTLKEKRQNSAARIGMILGEPCSSKTVLAYHLVNLSPIISNTGLPTILYFEIKRGITERALLQNIIRFFGEDPRDYKEDNTQFGLIDPVINLLTDNEINMIIFDESNRINEGVFEIIRQIFDRTSIIPLLLGTLDLLQVIDGKPQFESRVYNPETMSPLTDDEMVSTYLPELKIPRWRFNENTDKRLGIKIWLLVKPNLRKLQDLLDDARDAAQMKGDDWITEEHINIVIKTPGWRFNKTEKRKGRKINS
ncbi:MAG TPA: TniB family NTP-binding protein [Anaerovoracaceae bacterium]|nr:TniB family NTP-binding protein [Anaerovoracaceae bacterium]